MNFISENLSDLEGKKYPLNLKAVAHNISDEVRTNKIQKKEVISGNHLFFKESNFPFNSEFITSKQKTFEKVNVRVNGSSDNILTDRISDIFFKILDEDTRIRKVKDVDPVILHFIHKYVVDSSNPLIFKTNLRFDIDILQKKVQNIINIHRINDIRYINKFFEKVNNKLNRGGIFIRCVETFEQRKKRIFKKFPPILSHPYYALDFIFKRIFPKFCLTKKIYYSITKGKSRLISLAETLGRLVSCGFEILGYEEINNHIFFAARRISEPVYDKAPTYGFFIALKRIGKNGKIINVYKIRTMHPYSEYLQEYIWVNNKLKEGGKFKEDFRITPWGRVLRKYWLDELPMLWNFLKGDLKLFGVRPLSLQYYNLYENNIRLRRIKYKPGLIPPFFADMPKTFREILDSEIRYLDNYDQHPLKTDWKYFWRVMYNINIRHVTGG
jgi:hypothetical protein